ncbi:DUF3443 domain-containing protein [Noviherbaspirillum sp. UKPF54]|uniref:DUF3443 domain-containing protein n=1 Tax=Noviherbaspirillum sp. UKPF54 TaxID=2601898 RepID=UPI0011B1251D|nr:DUF3443 domain-containing protein [Noviherbaspirillum sp. UKPF54]QDZ27844.1 DUF3443 domain-containing protein [Noviherbaspirillum sp. UKPF54]
MRLISAFLSCALIASLAACGGGGGSDSAAPSSNTSVSSPASATSNVMAVSVELGPSNNVNIPYVTVTVCEPGSEVRCRSIDHVLLDTGSNGLRLFASALAATSSQSALSFPQLQTGGLALAECVQFADGSSVWGPVRSADVKLAGQRVSALPVHVVGDAGFAAIPDACSNSLTPATTAAQFGANGVLGVGTLDQDCGDLCSTTAQNGFYYACTSSSCSPSTAPLAQQVPNPVARFATDNNGVVVQLPGVAPGGAATVSGSLIFGIGTQSNNALGSAKVFNLDPASGYFTTIYNNRTYAKSFIDSGSNAIYFDDAGITICSGYDHGFYCPPFTRNLTATMIGVKVGGASGTVSFSVANADNLFHANPSFVAFPTLAGPMSGIDNTTPASLWSSYFDWGLPFFYGRSVFTAIHGRDTPGGKGPYYAY